MGRSGEIYLCQKDNLERIVNDKLYNYPLLFFA